MYLVEGRGKLGDEPIERHRQRGAPADEYVVMSGFEAAGTSPCGLAQSTADAVALGRVALLLGDREAHAGFIEVTRCNLQGKRRPPDAIAPGDPDEFLSFPEAAQRSLPRLGGSHRPMP